MPKLAWDAAENYERLDLAEVARVADSRLSKAVMELGGKAERLGNLNGYDFSTRTGAEKLLKILKEKRPRKMNLNPIAEESENKLIKTRRIQRNLPWAINKLKEEDFGDIYVEQPGKCKS
eukprot:6942915-Pyramimonas_sp.AAC.1